MVLPLTAHVDCTRLRALFCESCDPDAVAPPPTALTTLASMGLKQRFSVAFPPTSNLYALLDVAKVIHLTCAVGLAMMDDTGMYLC